MNRQTRPCNKAIRRLARSAINLPTNKDQSINPSIQQDVQSIIEANENIMFYLEGRNSNQSMTEVKPILGFEWIRWNLKNFEMKYKGI